MSETQLPSQQLSADGYLAADNDQQEIIGNYYQHLQAISGGQADVDRLALRPIVRYLSLIYFNQSIDPNNLYRPAVGNLLLEIAPYIIGTQNTGNPVFIQRENAAVSEPILLTAIEQGLLQPVERFCSSSPIIEDYHSDNLDQRWEALGRAWGSAPRVAKTTPHWSEIYTILHCSGWCVFLDDALTNVAGILAQGRPELEQISEHRAVDISPAPRPSIDLFLKNLNYRALIPAKDGSLSHSLGQIIADQCQGSGLPPESLPELFPSLLSGMNTALLNLSAALPPERVKAAENN